MKNKIAATVCGFWIASAGVVLAADADAGKAVYEKSCVGCHGKDGKGNPAMAKVLEKRDWILQARKRPKSRTRSFSRSLSREREKCPRKNR